MSPANGLVAEVDGDNAAAKRNARAARFSNKLPGNRYKELEEARTKEREAFLQQGSITAGQTALNEAVDLHGSCEDMCTPYEREFREYTREINPFEKRSLDYLIDDIMQQQPPPNPNAINPPAPTPRRALGFSSGFIRDRTRAIRKEFALQSSWGHEEAIASFERIARWHILCLRELQEETGNNVDMHIDNAELGRCFTSLRQHYNDRREETGVDMPCANEPEFRAYMLIYDLASKSVSIQIAELPRAILDDPLVQLAWEIRQAAQRNFDSQKEGSKLNAELGANLITRFTRLLKQDKMPYLFSCLVEIRLREMRRSAIRALTRTYPRLKTDPIRRGADGEIAERKMVLMPALDRLLGAEEQETEASAWDDIKPISKNPDDESAAVVQRFDIPLYHEPGDSRPMGALINLGSPYNDNRDAPFTRRWKFITDKLSATNYADVVNGRAGVGVGGGAAAQPASAAPPAPKRAAYPQPQTVVQQAPAIPNAWAAPTTGAFPSTSTIAFPTTSTQSAFATNGTTKPGSAFQSSGAFTSASNTGKTDSAFKTANRPAPSAFDFKASSPAPSAFATTPKETTPVPSTPASKPIPNFFESKAPAAESTTPKAPPPPTTFDLFPKKDAAPPAETKPPAPLFAKPSLFDAPAKPAPTPAAGPSQQAIPNFFQSSSTPPAVPPAITTPAPSVFSMTPKVPSPKVPTPPRTPAKPVIPLIQVSRTLMRTLPADLADLILREVADAMIRDAESDFVRMVRQRQAADEYKQTKAERQALVKRQAREIADEMLDDYIKSELFGVWFRGMQTRMAVRDIAMEWREWARTQAHARRVEEQQRERDKHQLSSFGLGKTYRYMDGGSASSSTRSASAALSTLTVTESVLDAEASFRETEEARRAFWDSDSALLRLIAAHVAPLLRHEQGARPLWETVLLTAGEAGSSAGQAASDWLASKLLPPRRSDTFYHGDVAFRSHATSVHDDFPGSPATGLYIFEAPLITLDTEQRSRNIDDASDRLDAAAGSAQQGSMYRSSLLILTWEEETLEEVVDRLGIARDIESFDAVAAMSIHDPSQIMDLFTGALEELIPSDPRKSQVVLPLNSIAERLEQRYQELLRVAENCFREFPTEARLVPYAFKAAVELLSSVSDAVAPVVEELGDESTYRPPKLPPFDVPTGTVDGASVAAAIETYLSKQELASVGGVFLACAELRNAAKHGYTLPVREALDELGAYVREGMRYATLRLAQWYDAPEHVVASNHLRDSIMREVSVAAERAVHSLAEQAQLERGRRAPLPPSPPLTPDNDDDDEVVSAGHKRQRDDDVLYPLKSKTARLASLLAGASAGLAQAEAALERATASPRATRGY